MPYSIPKDAYDASVSAVTQSSWWTYPVAFLTGNVAGFEKNAAPPLKNEDSGADVYLHNGLVNFQGPNYALAKSLQNWRAILLHHSGAQVSANYAPPAKTNSVMHSATAAKALKGASYFHPLAAFEPETVAPLMAKLMISDLLFPGSDGDINPYDIFRSNAFHGGSWRCAWSYDSIGTAAFLLGSVTF
tara:strand:+ start:681 stop:1244 length:564 start_codon:yes stop_codon:yes gene_type:complete